MTKQLFLLCDFKAKRGSNTILLSSLRDILEGVKQTEAALAEGQAPAGLLNLSLSQAIFSPQALTEVACIPTNIILSVCDQMLSVYLI